MTYTMPDEYSAQLRDVEAAEAVEDTMHGRPYEAERGAATAGCSASSCATSSVWLSLAFLAVAGASPRSSLH